MNLKVNKKVLLWILLAAVIVTAITLGLVFGLRTTKSSDGSIVGSSIVGAVVSNGRGCADVGSQMLDDGGSAVDAAIATLLCEGALLPHSMGIGGGFVATIYTKATGAMETVIARESAPAAATQNMFVGETSVTGAKSAAVPGELMGYWQMHQKYGRLDWRHLFQPTIRLCREGHWVSKYLAAALVTREDRVRGEPTLAEVFVKEDGTLYKEGDTLKRTQLGETLERIAEKGINEMYGGGEVGRMLAEDIQEMGGLITEQDLKDFKVRWESNNHITANVTDEYKLYTTPLPSSGILIAFMLNVLNGLYTDKEEIYWQRAVETFKHAYGLRSNLGDMENDPEWHDTIADTMERLQDPAFIESVKMLIHDDKTFSDYSYYGANFSVEEDHGTANMAVLAPNGDAVVVTSTINTYFGAKVRSRRTGIILNDEMDDFSTPGLVNGFGVPASPSNYIKPGKRPMSSMAPAIILDHEGNVRMLVGAAGGTKITTTVVSTILKYLVFNETLNNAVNDGRLHHQLAPMVIETEASVPENIRNYLESVGHVLEIAGEGTGFAAVTTIGVRDGVPTPFFDDRRVGSTATLQKKNKMNH